VRGIALPGDEPGGPVTGKYRNLMPYYASASRSAQGSVGAWLRLLLPAVGGLALDLWSKAYVEQNLKGQDEIDLWPGKLVFRYTENQGAVFGWGQGHVGLFIIFSVIALGVIGAVFMHSRRNQGFLHVALGLITAGALGNLYDRAVHGRVRDFILMLQDYWPYIFNVADVLLCIGVPLLMICWIFQPDSGKR
jgi:signal peptidase II